MNGLDWIIVVILSVSALFSLLRGFIREAISLVAWVAAFALAVALSSKLAVLLEPHVAVHSLRMILAFIILFVSVLFVAGLVNRLLAALLKVSGLGAVDRVLGMGFGVMRGVIVVLVLLIVLPPLLSVDQQPWWRESVLVPRFLMLEDWAMATFSDLAAWRQDVFSRTVQAVEG